MHSLGLPFSVVPADLDEEKIAGTTPFKTLKLRALAKAEAVIEKISRQGEGFDKQTIVISCDSGCVLKDDLIGKPQDKNEAFEILKKLAGKTHFFVTAMYIFKLERQASRFKVKEKKYSLTKTKLTLRKMTDIEIASYVKKYDLTPYAGAYSLLDLPQDFVTKIEGSFTNVLGLPVEELGIIS